MNWNRKSGVLLHPTSFPGKYGIGELGREAYQFIDFLTASGQKLWQIFPLGHTGYGDSPYQSFSAFAGNPLLISLELLKEEGFLKTGDMKELDSLPVKIVDFGKLIPVKNKILKTAYENFISKASPSEKKQFKEFIKDESEWLLDYSIFMALKESFGGKPWYEWPESEKLRDTSILNQYSKSSRKAIEFYQFLQYVFFKQWLELKSYANKNGVEIIGDIPIFVSYDSADAWSHPELFLLNEDRIPRKVAGVPPDYFSVTGQLWGNPLYDWKRLKKDKFRWWIERFRKAFVLADYVRLDHFRGFAAYWAVNYGDKTAEKGSWEKAPGRELFIAVEKALGKLPIIAEDLGVITPDVVELREKFGFPGMKVLQFAFDSNEENDYLPHNYTRNAVVYTGTHDNDTTLGWFQKASRKDKEHILKYTQSKGKDIVSDVIRLAWSSVAVFAVVPMQDLLGLGSQARMNTPGKFGGNWQWRYRREDIKPEISRKLMSLTKLYGR